MDIKHTAGSTSFSLGCKDNQMCGKPSYSAGELIGRDLNERETNDCVECCGSNNCNKNLCTHSKLDGNWADWSLWSNCNVTCDKGIRFRERTCSNPAPIHGGLNCTGNSKERETCSMPLCPVNGGWGTWYQWEPCSVTCDVGIQRRHRNCSNPYPEIFGDHCFGDVLDVRICLPAPCANGGWSNWGMWSSCSTTCGGGIISRTRACNNPVPSLTGKACEGETLMVSSCNANPCSGIPSVIFQSKDVTTMTYSDGDRLIFAKTISNDGNGYDNGTGIFTAPIAGTYIMSTHICAETEFPFGFAFVSDNQEVHRDLVTKIPGSVHCDTSDITLHLSKGSQVYLKCTFGGKLYQSDLYWNTFSGSVLHL